MTIYTETTEELHAEILNFFKAIENGVGHDTVVVFPDGSCEDYEGIMAFLNGYAISDFEGGAEEASANYIKLFC